MAPTARLGTRSLALDAEVLHQEVVLPVIGHELVKGRILLDLVLLVLVIDIQALLGDGLKFHATEEEGCAMAPKMGAGAGDHGSRVAWGGRAGAI